MTAARGASETRSLELARAAEKLKSEHARTFSEAVLRKPISLANNSTPGHGPTARDSSATGTPTTGSSKTGTSAAGPSAETAVDQQDQRARMVGRVRIDGKDAGVVVDYEPGAMLSTKLVEQIASQLPLSTSAAALIAAHVELEFVGTISIEHPTTISIHLLPLSDGATQSITVDEQLLPIATAVNDQSSQRYDVELLRGDYVLRWRATLAAEGRLSIRVTDQATGESVMVMSPPATLPGQLNRATSPNAVTDLGAY
jgi:hypothetical protein